MTKFSYFLGSEQWQPEDLIKHAEIARDSGFDMLTISEHFHPWVDDYSASNFTWSTLGALANNCLLYTSPSPRDSDSSRMPSSA